MTPEAQRIAIAEACPKLACKNIYGQLVWIENQSRFFDPLNDLNAMHEAEKVLIGPRTIHYETILERMVLAQATTQPGDRYPRAAAVCSWHATAAQRAEAFLRTLSLWKA